MAAPKKCGGPKGHAPYPGCETGGRPLEYTQEKINAFADEFTEWQKDPSNIWFKDFCIERDINPDLLVEWSNKNDKFSGAYKLAKHRQESRLVNGGLLDSYNAGIVKFVLANAHGWSEKNEAKVSGDAENQLAFILKMVDNTSRELVNEKNGLNLSNAVD